MPIISVQIHSWLLHSVFLICSSIHIRHYICRRNLLTSSYLNCWSLGPHVNLAALSDNAWFNLKFSCFMILIVEQCDQAMFLFPSATVTEHLESVFVSTSNSGWRTGAAIGLVLKHRKTNLQCSLAYCRWPIMSLGIVSHIRISAKYSDCQVDLCCTYKHMWNSCLKFAYGHWPRTALFGN